MSLLKKISKNHSQHANMFIHGGQEVGARNPSAQQEICLGEWLLTNEVTVEME